MPVESATFISDLVVTNPPGSDGLGQADDHLRLIKAVIKATFPNITGAVNTTQAELNQLHTGTRTLGLADGSSGSPSVYFDSDTDNGFYRPSADHLNASKRLGGNGTVPVGSIHSFPIDPGSTLCARGGTATGAEQFIELDGSTYTNATFPDLATFLGQGGTTFVVPDLKTTGKFLRHRTGSVAVGTAQSNQNKTHTHTLTSVPTDSQGAHQHDAFIGDDGHTHGIPSGTSNGSPGRAAGTSNTDLTAAATSGATTGVKVRSTAGNAATADNKVASAGAHTHSVTGTTDSDGGTEARPEAYVVWYCLKT